MQRGVEMVQSTRGVEKVIEATHWASRLNLHEPCKVRAIHACQA
jgi:hypothetical protein